MNWGEIVESNPGPVGPPPPPGMRPASPPPSRPPAPAAPASGDSESASSPGVEEAGKRPDAVSPEVAKHTLLIHDRDAAMVSDERRRKQERAAEGLAMAQARVKTLVDEYYDAFSEEIASGEMSEHDDRIVEIMNMISGTTVGQLAEVAESEAEANRRRAEEYVRLRIRKDAERRFDEDEAKRIADEEDAEEESSGRPYVEFAGGISDDEEGIAWILDGTLHESGLAHLVAAPYTGKTLAAVSFGWAVANGADEWMGKPLLRSGQVVYFAAEGGDTARLAVRAARKWHADRGDPVDEGNANFALIPEKELDWGLDVSVARLDRKLEQAGITDPVLVVMDTQIDVVGAIDENSSEMGRLLHRMRRWAVQRGCLLIAVHHSGHGSQRARGSSAQLAKVDASFRVEGSKDSPVRKLEFDKVKGAMTPAEALMAVIETVDLGVVGKGGRPVTGAYLRGATEAEVMDSALSAISDAATTEVAYRRKVIDSVRRIGSMRDDGWAMTTAVVEDMGGRKSDVLETLNALGSEMVLEVTVGKIDGDGRYNSKWYRVREEGYVLPGERRIDADGYPVAPVLEANGDDEGRTVWA